MAETLLCCKTCGSSEIHNKKRKLCKKCYYKQSNAKYRDIHYPKRKQMPVSDVVKKATIIKNMRKKHGIEFIKDMKKIKTQQFWTLQTLAEKYGLSRERVRQLFNAIYEEPFTKYRLQKIKERESGEYLGCNYDPRRKVADCTNKKSNTYHGALAEKLFFEQCEKYNFEISIPCRKEIDIIVNNYIIDVKSSRTNHENQKNSGRVYYRAKLTMTQRQKCDFFAWYISDQDSFYIIPNKEKGGNYNNVKVLYIPKIISEYRSAKNWFVKYKNAFHLLN